MSEKKPTPEQEKWAETETGSDEQLEKSDGAEVVQQHAEEQAQRQKELREEDQVLEDQPPLESEPLPPAETKGNDEG